MIAEFGSAIAVLTGDASDRARLSRTVAGDRRTVRHIVRLRASLLHLLRAPTLTGPILANWQTLLDYLRASMAREPVESARVLYLTARNRLIRDEEIARGTVNHVAVDPAHILRRALELGATALILVHNHPSGDPEPSRSDRDATWRLIEAAKRLDIAVHDHIIVGADDCVSFRSLNLM